MGNELGKIVNVLFYGRVAVGFHGASSRFVYESSPGNPLLHRCCCGYSIAGASLIVRYRCLTRELIN